jgi:methanesulfonate monooxygenase large subunit
VAEVYDFRTAERADVTLVVTRGDDGRIRTFINVCSHRGARVVMDPGGNARTHT